MSYLPYGIDHIITARQSVIDRCDQQFGRIRKTDYDKWSRLTFGFAAQWENDQICHDAGIQILLADDTHWFDRFLEIGAIIEDDKLSRFQKHIQAPAPTHTIGKTEHPEWDVLVRQGDDVIVNLFGQQNYESFSSKYFGSVSWSKMFRSPIKLIHDNKNGDGTKFIWRETVLKKARA